MRERPLAGTAGGAGKLLTAEQRRANARPPTLPFRPGLAWDYSTGNEAKQEGQTRKHTFEFINQAGLIHKKRKKNNFFSFKNNEKGPDERLGCEPQRE